MASKWNIPRREWNQLAIKLRERRGQDPPAFAVSPEEAIASGAATTEIGQILFGQVGRRITKWSHYLEAYEAEFEHFRGRPIRMLEIGVYEGGSLQLWHEYFGPDAIIFGVDIDPQCAEIHDAGVEVRIGSQGDPEFLAQVVAEMGGVDIILDDGSHVAHDQRTSFKTLFPLLSDGGIYAVEDLHTSYWPEYGGAYRRGDSFVELTKALVDDMHSWYHTKGQSVPVDAAQTIPRIDFYDSIVFIHKAAKSRPSNFKTAKSASRGTSVRG